MATKTVCDVCGNDNARSEVRLYVSNTAEIKDPNRKASFRKLVVHVQTVPESESVRPPDLCDVCWLAYLGAITRIPA